MLYFFSTNLPFVFLISKYSALDFFVSKSKYINNGLIRFGVVGKFTRSCIEKFGVKSGTPTTEVQSLSGGNLQKFIVGRELLHEPNVIIAAQPTWGLDVGAIDYVHRRILELRSSGGAVLLLTLDLEELFKLADRVLVLYRGSQTLEGLAGDIKSEQLAVAMAGGSIDERQ